MGMMICRVLQAARLYRGKGGELMCGAACRCASA